MTGDTEDDPTRLRGTSASRPISAALQANRRSLLPRWEAALYTMVIAIAFWETLRRGTAYSRQFDRGGLRYGELPGLAPGWVFGHCVDLSDIQWRIFRQSLPALVLTMSAFAVGGRLVRRFGKRRLISYYLVGSTLYTGYLHGFSSLLPFVLVVMNYSIACICRGRKFSPAIIWCWNASILLLVRLFAGLSFAAISTSLAPLDNYKGAQRWHVSFNLVHLRCISFAMDYHWAMKDSALSAGPSKPSIRQCIKDAKKPPLSEYTFGMYLAYVFYPPLYIAGPIMTFDAFAAQVTSNKPLRLRHTMLYVMRLAASILILELMAHYLYANAIAKHGVWIKAITSSTSLGGDVADVGITGFWVLNFMWLKFLVIWRFFRAAALMDGIEPPENMLRCVNNNYDIEGFWRGWHASFNRWLVRYLYIPLGGASQKILTIWVVFTYVAVWHDIEWKMISWAWLMCFVFIPELALKWTVAQSWSRFEWIKASTLFRHLAAFCATCNIAMLMAINLLGFVIGINGIRQFWLLYWASSSSCFLTSVFVTFYASAQIMFALRDHERRVAPRRAVQR